MFCLKTFQFIASAIRISEMTNFLPFQWSTPLPQFYIKFHRVKIISMRCDAANIASGEHGTGRVAVYSRGEIARRRYQHLEHELGAGVDKKTFDAVRPRYVSFGSVLERSDICLIK